MVFIHCPLCGKKLDQKEIGDEGLVPFCFTCNSVFFNFSWPCVLCLVADEKDNVVLIRESADGKYGGVAGFIKQGETMENAANREVKEEIGLTVYEQKFIKSCGFSDRLMMCFICKVENDQLILSKENYSAEWFPITEAQKLVRQGSVISQLIEYYLQNQCSK